jgi:hypothetical protein
VPALVGTDLAVNLAKDQTSHIQQMLTAEWKRKQSSLYRRGGYCARISLVPARPQAYGASAFNRREVVQDSPTQPVEREGRQLTEPDKGS